MSESQTNATEFTVSELSAHLRRTVEDAYGYVRVRGEVSGFKGASPSGHVYFRLKDDKAVLESVIWKGVFGRMRIKPEEGLEVIASGKLTTFAGSSKYQIVIDALEPAGVGALMALLEERRRKLAAEGLFDDARKQTPAIPARSDRRRHLADRRGDPRHPASSRRPLSAPCHRLAGEGAGRRLRRAGRQRDPRLQRAARKRKNPPARSADRRPRRRLAGGSLVVQRGDRGAGSGRQHDSADFRRGPRDRFHVDRLCRRQARADADRRGRNGGAGARRPDR